ncbi:acyl-CoA dehydrogenase domain protein [Parafrankia sp. EAN1pec]|uniref:acyl-CoA dehydrogenase family protein n=1 Tax=Parafrankia sp. (strain EAN1pec) TaxID=298653 RepID=UPI00005406AC|nr:acyl-CoA dehydrogenase domain protein [Frankia sp. EAN1pec]
MTAPVRPARETVELDLDPVVLAPTAEQRQLRAVVREFLVEVSPEERVRRDMESPAGYDPATWTRLARELDLVGLAVPERFGGSGYTVTELAVVVEEAARALLCAPLLATAVLAAGVLQASGDEAACARWLPELARGDLVATVTLPDRPDSSSGVTARATAAGWRLEGRLERVLYGHIAGLVLVVVQTAEGPTLFACECGPAITVTPLRVLDMTRGRADLVLWDAPAVVVGEPGEAAPLVGMVLDLGRTALAAEAVAISGLVLERCLDYVRTRRQFGRPIGSFQALKHRLADLLVEVEAARSAAAYAVWSAAGAVAGDLSAAAQLPMAACAAKAVGDDTAGLAAAEFVQMHGGIGFTWEHSAHLYVRRVRSNSVLLGTSTAQRRRIAHLLGLPGAGA